MCVCVRMLTFVPADFYISKQANFDNLPEQSQNQMGFPSHQVMGVNAHHRAADRRGRIQSQDQILLQIVYQCFHFGSQLEIRLQPNSSTVETSAVVTAQQK